MSAENEPSGWDKFKQTLPDEQRHRIEAGGEYLATGRSQTRPEPVVHIEPEHEAGDIELVPTPRPASLALARLKRALRKIEHLGEK